MNYLKISGTALLILLLFTAGCVPENEQPGVIDIDVAEAQRLLENEDGVLIIDVRPEREYLRGHIPGAVLLPHDAPDFVSRLSQYVDSGVILVYCRRGNRSRFVLPLIEENFDGQIFHLKSGYRRWLGKN